MVLTNSNIHGRYDLIRRPESAPLGSTNEPENNGLQSKNYATFLKEQERKVGPDGFVDSGRFSYTYQRKNDSRNSVPGTPRIGVINLHDKVQKEEKSHQTCLKAIEDLMWQHKQEERELKRIEGDIVKNQQSVRHTLRDYENAINKKKLSEAKKLSHSLAKYTVLQQDHIYNKELTSVDRRQNDHSAEQSYKDQGRKVVLNTSDLARKYRTKICEIDLKRTELMRLNQEYETKLKDKESEQLKLKKEAADLALSLNMEVQKGRVQKFEAEQEKQNETKQRIEEDLETEMKFTLHLAKSDGDIKAAESQKRKLSADLNRTKTHLDIKKRDEQRHLIDTKIRLGSNVSTQRQLNDEAKQVEMDKTVKKMNQKIQEHNERKINQLNNSMKEKKEKHESLQVRLEARFKKRLQEQQKRENEHKLKFFKKMVTKDEDLEQDLYTKVRTTEYDRQKQDQQLRRTELQLAELKRKNATKLKEEMTDRNAQELLLEQKIIREKAELDKMHATREESYQRLQKHRQYFKEDQYLLSEHQRENSRLFRIGAKTGGVY